MHFHFRQVNRDVVVPVMKILNHNKQSDRDQKTDDDGIGCRLTLLVLASALAASFADLFHFFLPGKNDFFGRLASDAFSLLSAGVQQRKRLNSRPHGQAQG
jgi:hypothetical protein